MKALTAFLPELAVDTLGAPQVLQLQQIRNAAIDFCERSRVWQCVEQYPLEQGNVVYEFDRPAGQTVVEIRDGHLVEAGLAPPIVPRTPAWLNDFYPGWQEGRITGQPCAVCSLDPATFIPVPAPQQAYVVSLTLALKPTRDATLLPDVLFNDYYDAIVDGAKARMMAMPKKAWTNPQLAVAYGTSFDDMAMRALRRVEKGFGRGRHRVRGRYV